MMVHPGDDIGRQNRVKCVNYPGAFVGVALLVGRGQMIHVKRMANRDS